jgi:hypothetical protein
MKLFFVISVTALVLIIGIVSAYSEDTVIEVINLNVGNGTETLIATLAPEDFKDVQIIRHNYGYGKGNYETRGILIDANEEKWDGYWDDNQGYSIKTIINGTTAEEGRLVVGSIEYVPFGFSTREEAVQKARQIVDSPVFIDLSQQEKASLDKKEAEKIERIHKESVEDKEVFEGSQSGESGAGSGLEDSNTGRYRYY